MWGRLGAAGMCRLGFDVEFEVCLHRQTVLSFTKTLISNIPIKPHAAVTSQQPCYRSDDVIKRLQQHTEARLTLVVCVSQSENSAVRVRLLWDTLTPDTDQWPPLYVLWRIHSEMNTRLLSC